MSQGDVIEHGPPPGADAGAFGTRAIVRDGRYGVRVMLKGFDVMVDRAGEPVAYVEIGSASAVQAVQALRQAISDARKGRL